jgi:Heterokaryon incompatibility protein (HET)
VNILESLLSRILSLLLFTMRVTIRPTLIVFRSLKLPRTTNTWYKHATLEGERQIRLLKIKPRGWLDSTIDCELFPVNVDDRPQYTALSCSWGDPTACREIRLNGHRFRTSASVHAFLEAVSSGQVEHTVWVDFVCIDQDNLDERSKQLPLTRDIYLSA